MNPSEFTIGAYFVAGRQETFECRKIHRLLSFIFSTKHRSHAQHTNHHTTEHTNTQANTYFQEEPAQLELWAGVPSRVNPTCGLTRCAFGRICVKRSTGHTHTHRQRTTPPTTTNTHAHDENNTSEEHLPQALNNARRWRDDGACHQVRRSRVEWWCFVV